MEYIINQTYTAPPHPVNISLLLYIVYCIISLLIIICLIFVIFKKRQNAHQQRKPPSIPLTKTEIIHTTLNAILPETLIKLILIDYCGYQNIPYLEHVVTLKRKFKRTQIIRCGQITLKHVVMCILIASLLFAAYCGIIFLVQNDQYLKKYSIPIQLNCDENICTVNNNGRGGWGPKGVSDLKYSITPHFHEYQNFYNNTFIPYLKTLNDPNLMEHFQNNPTLYVSIKTQNLDDYSGDNEDSPIWKKNNYGPNRADAYLHLNENAFSDSDFSLATVQDDIYCCWRCTCFKKGGGYGCAGCDCYCQSDAYIHGTDVMESSTDCCWCCICNWCTPCHCVCGSCCLCWTGVAISMLLLCICFSIHRWIASDFFGESELISVLEGIVEEMYSIDNEWSTSV